MLVMVSSKNAPAALGPYSHAVVCGNLVFCSGQVGVNPRTGRSVSESVTDQTRQALENLREILDAAESDLSHVLRTTVYLSSMEDFNEMNRVYSDYFRNHLPARATVEVGRLYGGLAVEIDAIAAKIEDGKEANS